jgi:hypothetical protein
LQVFFCKYNDPSYVKMEKLDIMMKLVNERNIDQVGAAGCGGAGRGGCRCRCRSGCEQ